jgi:hypothetical protein
MDFLTSTHICLPLGGTPYFMRREREIPKYEQREVLPVGNPNIL